MLPISRDTRIKKAFYGVEYSFLPAVGDVETFLMSSIKEDYTIEQLRESYNSALVDLEKEYKGRRKPQKKQWEALLVERQRKYLPDNGNDIKMVNETIDKILVGWDIKDIKFPDDGRPSNMLKLALKTEMYTWYWGEFNLSEDESKN